MISWTICDTVMVDRSNLASYLDGGSYGSSTPVKPDARTPRKARQRPSRTSAGWPHTVRVRGDPAHP